MLFLVAVYAGLVLASELGFRFGRWLQARSDEKQHHLEDAVQTAALGLLALLLGFSFSLVAYRYDSRVLVIVNEANAINTAYHDGELFPEPHQSEFQATFRRYVAMRIRAYDLGTDTAADAAVRSKELQERLWKQMMLAARDERVAPEFSAEVSRSLSRVADTAEDAVSAFENKLPLSMMKLLFAIAGIATWISGYCDGVRVKRLFLVMVVQPLLISLVITVIADMDQSFRGWLHVSKKPLLRTQETMQ